VVVNQTGPTSPSFSRKRNFLILNSPSLLSHAIGPARSSEVARAAARSSDAARGAARRASSWSSDAARHDDLSETPRWTPPSLATGLDLEQVLVVGRDQLHTIKTVTSGGSGRRTWRRPGSVQDCRGIHGRRPPA
jgi:hypothetical protein